ncbi:MAG: GNAT family N-acetyltransferase [Deltaproteobacteria bacterium]|nr:GNAT family N-acetyltransferase [Deltaproteobacteria bacterium]MCB9788269.1 GNAT family N-acetyltransferase [Deltaproteobacteria bacterium]
MTSYERRAPGLRADGIGRLEPRHRFAAVRFLSQEVAHNAYLLAQIDRGAIGRDDVAGPMLGHWTAGELDGICVFGSNLVFSRPASDAAIVAFADYAAQARFRVWVIVGEDRGVDRFMDRYGRGQRGIRVERPDQRLYCLRPGELTSDARSSEVRQADITEVELLMEADRAMVEEELGFDPFASDLNSFREGWRRRVREGRSWVVGEPGEPLRFKADQSAAASQVVQLAGIFTHPRWRRRGIARGAVAEVCRALLRTTPLVTLYVHADNEPAIRLYEGLGFREAGRVRSVWFDL